MGMIRQSRLLAGRLVSIVALLAMGCVCVSSSRGTASTQSWGDYRPRFQLYAFGGLTAPANNAGVSGTISLSCTVPSNVEWIHLDVDNNFYASGSAYATSYTTTWNSASVADGSHSIGCAGYGSNGALIVNSVANITVSNSVATPSGGAGCTTIPGTGITVGAACLLRSNYPALGTSYDPINYGADSTGVADSSVAVNTALGHGNVYFGTPGTYLLNGAGVGRYIPVTTAGTVIECAAGVTLKTTLNGGNPFSGSLTAIFLVDANNVSIAGCTFVGPGPNSGNTNNGNLMIWVYNAQGALIEGNTFTNVIADAAIQFDDETNTTTGPQSYVQYNDFLNDRVYGPAVIYGQYITFQNNYALNSSIGVESDDLNSQQVPQPMGHITITHNEYVGDASSTINGGYSPGANVDNWPGGTTYSYYGTNTLTGNYCSSPGNSNGIIYDAGQAYVSPYPTVTGNTLGTGCVCASAAPSC